MERFRQLAVRRVAGVPVAYLVGTREFYGRPFFVDERVLIPRPETELLVDEALRWIDAEAPRSRLRVLDLGTGSGAIAITLALERDRLDVVATDRSHAALAVARRNGEALGARLGYLESDWFDALDPGPSFDLMVANPPYVASSDAHLEQGDLRFEPRVALTDDGDGTTALARIVDGARHRLVAGALLVLEHGHDQAATVRRMMVEAGYRDVCSTRDLSGIERVTRGRG